MIIDVDIGNSRIKWRFADVPHSFGVLDTCGNLPKEWNNLPRQSRIRISSVVGAERTLGFINRLASLENVAVEIAVVKNPFAGVDLAYADISTYGVDRWLALLAAKARYPSLDCVVVQAGTAVVADFLRASGRHLGGFIAAGWQTSLRSLGSAAHALSHFTGDAADFRRNQPGETTLECIEAGTALQVRGFLRELSLAAADQLNSPIWIFTGGDAELLISLFDQQFGAAAHPDNRELVRELVLEGLAIALP